jgi:hypothetical protein
MNQVDTGSWADPLSSFLFLSLLVLLLSQAEVIGD